MRPPAITRVVIDASAHCQLACPSCPTASGATRAALRPGHLDPVRFAALLDANPQIAEIELSNYGEMFLNPRLIELLRTAWEREVSITADNGVNLNHANCETLEALIRYRVRGLTVSIDGASPETYARYRVKGDFHRVVSNIRQINDFRREHRSMFPLLTWQFIVFGHNEHEIEAARRMAAELGMGFKPKISWDDDFSPVRDSQLVQLQAGIHATRAEHYRAKGTDFARSICHQLWRSPVLNWDGRMLGCCRNFWGDFGSNAFEDGLSTSLASEKIENARQALMGRAPMDGQAPCASCDLYLTMKQDGNWIQPQEVAVPESAVLFGVVPVRGTSEATHTDIFPAPGHRVDPLLLARPPRAQRVELGAQIGTLFVLRPGDYTICVLPRRLDPSYRRKFPAMAPVTVPVTVRARPVAQQIAVELDES